MGVSSRRVVGVGVRVDVCATVAVSARVDEAVGVWLANGVEEKMGVGSSVGVRVQSAVAVSVGVLAGNGVRVACVVGVARVGVAVDGGGQLEKILATTAGIDSIGRKHRPPALPVAYRERTTSVNSLTLTTPSWLQSPSQRLAGARMA